LVGCAPTNKPIVNNFIGGRDFSIVSTNQINAIADIPNIGIDKITKHPIINWGNLYIPDIIINPNAPINDTVFFMVTDNGTVYRQYPYSLFGDTVVNNWFAKGYGMISNNSKIITAPDPTQFRYIKRVK
jgi:hypothetical protein